MSVAAALFEENADIAKQCLDHSFVRGLADGSLREELFSMYVAQDSFFLKAFFRAYALALSKSENEELSKGLLSLSKGVLEEIELHKSYSKSLSIDLLGVKPLKQTQSYVDFLLRVAHEKTAVEILVAMAPCMRLYAYLGEKLSKIQTSTRYNQWIDTYASRDFEDLAKTVERLIDDHAVECTSFSELYGYAMQCELAFFDAYE